MVASADFRSADLLRVPEAAAYLNMTVAWVRRRIDRREIPYIKMGNYVMFRREDLDAYVRANLVTADEDASWDTL